MTELIVDCFLMSSADQNTACPLCRSTEVHDYSRDIHREYLYCPVCGLVFVPSCYFLSPEDEKKRYDLHRNSPDDPGYRSFLNRLFVPLQRALAPGSRGLDFGSGPEPVLSRMFENAGYSVTLFDRYYEPASGALEQQYDFITASEVVEHLRDPAAELERLWTCLKPGGLLGIMTQPVVARDAFPAWHYKNDRTHLCFYSRAAFSWLAQKWKADLSFPEKDVFLFRKRS